MEDEMTRKKEYLKQYGVAVRQIARSEMIINEIRMNKILPGHVVIGLPRGSVQTDLSDYAVKLEEETERYLKARYHRIRLCTEIRDKIEAMTDENEKDILTYRYIKLMKWEGKNGICEKMGISERKAYRLHGLALLHFKI